MDIPIESNYVTVCTTINSVTTHDLISPKFYDNNSYDFDWLKRLEILKIPMLVAIMTIFHAILFYSIQLNSGSYKQQLRICKMHAYKPGI